MNRSSRAKPRATFEGETVEARILLSATTILTGTTGPDAITGTSGDDLLCLDRFLGDRPSPRKALELLAQARDLMPPGDEVVGLRDVVQRFSASTRATSVSALTGAL